RAAPDEVESCRQPRSPPNPLSPKRSAFPHKGGRFFVHKKFADAALYKPVRKVYNKILAVCIRLLQFKQHRPHAAGVSEEQMKEKFKPSVGGQALMEGVMMRGPASLCMAVRRPDGTLDITTQPLTARKWQKIPLVRGVCGMIDNLVLGYQCLMHS